MGLALFGLDEINLVFYSNFSFSSGLDVINLAKQKPSTLK